MEAASSVVAAEAERDSRYLAAVVVVDTEYSVVVAVASLDSWAVVAQDYPSLCTTTQHIHHLGEMRNMREFTTTSDTWQELSGKGMFFVGSRLDG